MALTTGTTTGTVDQAPPDTADVEGVAGAHRRSAWRRVRGDPTAMLGLVLVVALICVAV